MRNKLRSLLYKMKAAVTGQLRALMPPMTPRVFFRALFGVLLFLCGIVYGFWLVIRLRRQGHDS